MTILYDGTLQYFLSIDISAGHFSHLHPNPTTSTTILSLNFVFILENH